MRILLALTYYRPYISGLTDYAARLAEELARRGHQVRVLTSRHDPQLPAREMIEGVEVQRVPVGLRVSKGVLMPAMPQYANRLLRESDVLNLHSPQLDGAYLSWMARKRQVPVLMTYQCDLNLPSGPLNWAAGRMAALADRITAHHAHKIVTLALDYARHSRLLRSRMNKVVEVLPPPAQLPQVSTQEAQAFRARHGVRTDDFLIGMNARLAAEKGVEYLAMALQDLLSTHPNAHVLYVGQYQNVLGEEKYAERLRPLIQALGDRWKFLGLLDARERAAFFKACDLTVLPSLNSTEAFGMVQVESMLAGTPVVASDLPGVRVAVHLTGMGLVVPPGNPAELAGAIRSILADPARYRVARARIDELFNLDRFGSAYENILQECLSKR